MTAVAGRISADQAALARHLLLQMLRVRRLEEKCVELYSEAKIRGFLHVYIGEEAVAAGVCAALRPDDYITSTHRGHGHAIGKGVSLSALMAEMFAKETGCCGGKGGSMHLSDPTVGMLGATGIVGGGIPIATGAALSAQLRGSDQVAVSFFGDGAANEGAFHESLNQAGVWKLPVIYVCENNLYGFSVPFGVASSVPDIAVRAAGYGFPGAVVDGMDVLAVYAATVEAVARARAGEGPTLLECKTYRYRGHSRFEKPNYRTDEELQAWQARDPIQRFEQQLRERGVLSDAEPGQVRTAVRAKLEEAIAFARRSPEPPPDVAMRYVFAAGSDALSP